MEVVVNDPVCDDFAPQRKYTYRFLKALVEGALPTVPERSGDLRVIHGLGVVARDRGRVR
jgi:hypothetical protein